MRQVITMIICVVIIITGGVCEIRYLNKSSVFLRSDMDYIKNAIENGNYKLAEEQIEKSYKAWEEAKNIWNIFINDEEIDDIDSAMIDLRKNVEFENKEDSLIALEKIKRELEYTVKRQNLEIDNIL